MNGFGVKAGEQGSAVRYVLASALLPALPFPVASAYLGRLRQLEPSPAEQREAHAALIRAGFLLPCGTLTEGGREAARKALGTVQ